MDETPYAPPIAPVQDDVSDVWYSSERRFRSPLKMRPRDDFGTLLLAPGEVRFRGENGPIVCAEVVGIALVRQPMPWMAWLMINLGMIAMPLVGYTRVLTWDHPPTVLALLVVNAFFFLMVGLTRWVEITYSNMSGPSNRAYFADGSTMRWGGLLGGTRRLRETMTAIVMPSGTEGRPNPIPHHD